MQAEALDDRVAAVAAIVRQRGRIPTATYRLQFNRDFTFNDARRIVPYLKSLGISHVYASPILKAGPGGHGYDICDHSQLDPVLGTEDDFEAFVDALHAHGMGLILDVVPNHMGINTDCNEWWIDVLENGPSSPYAKFFDIDWDPTTAEFSDKVLLPLLEDQYGRVLEAGLFRLVYDGDAFHIRYHEHILPVAPRTWTMILGLHLEGLLERLGEDDEHLQELQSIITAIGHLPARTETDDDLIAEGRREGDVVRRRVSALSETSPEVRSAIDRALEEINGDVADPASFELLDQLIDAQAYRPAFWRVASEEINYRRFFDINELAAIRVELPEVFEATHGLIMRLLAEGKADGLRVDHPDGLLKPAEYFQRLQDAYLLAVARHAGIDTSDEQDERALVERLRTKTFERRRPPLYVVAEKILSDGEELDEQWEIYGTTGYDFLNLANGVFVDGRHRRSFDRIYAQFIDRQVNFRELENTSKKMIMLVSFASEISVLGHELDRIASRHRWYRDFTRNSLIFAIREVIACLPVYRTYETSPDAPAAERDRRFVESAVAEAKRRNPRTAEALFDFLRDTLLLDNLRTFREEDGPAVIDFVLSFQQISGPVMAKGVEDTAFYIYNRLASLNEVGGNPHRFGTQLATFHRENRTRLAAWPHTLLAASTHDTKRSEDVRARINVLSERPADWRSALTRWSTMNAGLKPVADGEAAPDANDEYLLYQTLLGAWPGDGERGNFTDRIVSYMQKATKEAKVHTSWVNPNAEYDRATKSFVRAILDEPWDNEFPGDVAPIAETVAWFGAYNSLSQALLRLTVPGVPDIYQGMERFGLSLVDPDNRRPVRFEEAQEMLADLDRRDAEDRAALLRDLCLNAGQDATKLFITSRALRLREQLQDLFAAGDYVPLFAVGPRAMHVVAFARRHGRRWVVTAVSRLVASLTTPPNPPVGPEVWGDLGLRLPRAAPELWVNALTGETVKATRTDSRRALRAADLFGSFPVALLTAESG